MQRVARVRSAELLVNFKCVGHSASTDHGPCSESERGRKMVHGIVLIRTSDQHNAVNHFSPAYIPEIL